MKTIILTGDEKELNISAIQEVYDIEGILRELIIPGLKAFDFHEDSIVGAMQAYCDELDPDDGKDYCTECGKPSDFLTCNACNTVQEPFPVTLIDNGVSAQFDMSRIKEMGNPIEEHTANVFTPDNPNVFIVEPDEKLGECQECGGELYDGEEICEECETDRFDDISEPQMVGKPPGIPEVIPNNTWSTGKPAEQVMGWSTVPVDVVVEPEQEDIPEPEVTSNPSLETDKEPWSDPSFPIVKPEPVKDLDWECHNCQWSNSHDIDTCEACDTFRFEKVEEIESWECPNCQYLNEWGTENCDVCDLSHDSGVIEAQVPNPSLTEDAKPWFPPSTRIPVPKSQEVIRVVEKPEKVDIPLPPNRVPAPNVWSTACVPESNVQGGTIREPQAVGMWNVKDLEPEVKPVPNSDKTCPGCNTKLTKLRLMDGAQEDAWECPNCEYQSNCDCESCVQKRNTFEAKNKPVPEGQVAYKLTDEQKKLNLDTSISLIREQNMLVESGKFDIEDLRKHRTQSCGNIKRKYPNIDCKDKGACSLCPVGSRTKKHVLEHGLFYCDGCNEIWDKPFPNGYCPECGIHKISGDKEEFCGDHWDMNRKGLKAGQDENHKDI